MPCARPACPRGFSLLELLVVITIIGISLGLVVPAFQGTLDENHLTGRTEELVAALQGARSEALKRGPTARVSVTPNQAGDWAKGWTVFVDTTNNANGGTSPTTAAPNGNTLLTVAEALPKRLSQDAGKTSLSYVSYLGSGDATVTAADAPTAANGGFQSGTIRFVSGTRSRCISLAPPGVVDVSINAAVCP